MHTSPPSVSRVIDRLQGISGALALGLAGLLASDLAAAGNIFATPDVHICTPATCQSTGVQCGPVADGCGGVTASCGTCTPPQTCGGGGTANFCGTGTCVPTTCATAGKNCGLIGNGCGGTSFCGTCTSPQTCGGGGTANVCGTDFLIFVNGFEPPAPM